MADRPQLIVLAGPNGAGKTTVGSRLVKDQFGLSHFVNADDIARGLNVFAPENVAPQAARIMLERLKELGKRREDFGFETTLATRSFAPWIRELRGKGYEFKLVYLWLSEPGLAIRRVTDRVQQGGHSVPDEVVTRRYYRGVRNFFALYAPLASAWRVYDTSPVGHPVLVAQKTPHRDAVILIEDTWKRFSEIGDEKAS